MGPVFFTVVSRYKRVYTYISQQFQKTIIVLNPGEYYATTEDLLLSTVLGSCVAVILFNEKHRFGGMNHYMLPHDENRKDALREPGRYGNHAIELLLESMYSLGSSLNGLKAKVFGGGAVLNLSRRGADSIPQLNVDFAFRTLNQFSIPIVAHDVLGNQGRKLFFDPTTFKVRVKRLTRQSLRPVIEEEKELIETLLPDPPG